MPIKNFTHKGLKKFYYKGDESGIDPNHVIKVGDILDSMHASHHPIDLKAIFGLQFQEKKGSGKGVFSIEVNGNWRVTFEIEDDGAILVDYRDYHGKQIKSKK
jgi:proteic killer suppression protein